MMMISTLPETNIFAPENGWLEDDPFLLRTPIFRCYCWWLKSCTTWDVWNPINNGINYLYINWCRISAINSMLVSGRVCCLTFLNLLNRAVLREFTWPLGWWVSEWVYVTLWKMVVRCSWPIFNGMGMKLAGSRPLKITWNFAEYLDSNHRSGADFAMHNKASFLCRKKMGFMIILMITTS